MLVSRRNTDPDLWSPGLAGRHPRNSHGRKEVEILPWWMVWSESHRHPDAQGGWPWRTESEQEGGLYIQKNPCQPIKSVRECFVHILGIK